VYEDQQVKEMRELQELPNRPTKPLLVLCFGLFAFEFARRAQEDKIEVLRPKDWDKKQGILKLSMKFDENIEKVKLGNMTLLPLLHASSAVSFQFASRDFSGHGGNYFEYVGEKIADVLIKKVLRANRADDKLDKLWVKTEWKSVASE